MVYLLVYTLYYNHMLKINYLSHQNINSNREDPTKSTSEHCVYLVFDKYPLN